MKAFQPMIRPTVVAAAALLALAAHAQGHDHHATAAATPAAAAAAKADEMSEGEVRKVDTAAHKITLKHGPLKNLDMPAMTMAFQVNDPALLAKVKVGDKVRFVAANAGGQLSVTRIEPAR